MMDDVMLLNALHRIRTWFWHRTYRPSRTFSQFVAIDIRRDVEVVDTSRLDDGMLTVRIRTWNVLHVTKGIAPQPAFSDLRDVAVTDLWKWSGN